MGAVVQTINAKGEVSQYNLSANTCGDYCIFYLSLNISLILFSLMWSNFCLFDFLIIFKQLNHALGINL